MNKNHINIEQQLLLEIKESLDRIEQLASEPVVIDREWMEPKDICAILNISRRTLADYSKKGYIPYSRLGGRVYSMQRLQKHASDISTASSNEIHPNNALKQVGSTESTASPSAKTQIDEKTSPQSTVCCLQ